MSIPNVAPGHLRSLKPPGMVNTSRFRENEGLEGKQKNLKAGDIILRVDPRYFRPTEVESLLGDPSKAKEKLGWVPEITIQEMCKEMVTYDLEQAKQQVLLKQHSYTVRISNE